MSDKMATHFPLFIAALGAIGGFLFGYNTAIISGLLFVFTDIFQLSILTKGLVVSIIILGALVGSFASGYFADAFGRKKSVMLTCLLYMIGAILLITTDALPLLLIGRFITGLGVGFGSVVIPLYLSEMSPPKHRGKIVTTNQLMITVGILVAYLLNYYIDLPRAWHMLFIVSLMASIVGGAYMLWLPESPTWLLGPAKKSEKKLKTRMLVLGIVLSIIQQITGINIIIYYAPSVFIESGGLTIPTAMVVTIWLGVLNVIATIFSMWLLDKKGRRPLLLSGIAAMVIGLLALSASLLFHVHGLLPILSVMLYVAGFAIGLGPVTFLVIAEIFPLLVRGKIMGLCLLCNWFTNFLLTLFFLWIVKVLGMGYTFMIFAVISALSFIFLKRYLPETKGKSLEEIESTRSLK